MPDNRWQARANCLGANSAIFFPENVEGGGKDGLAAKAICAGCEVREECLTYALDNREAFGIWGGASERERRTIRRRRYLERGTPAAAIHTLRVDRR